MAFVAGQAKPFGLRDVKVTSIAASPVQADLDSSQLLTFNPKLTSGELMGDDAIKSVVAFIIGGEWKLEAGGLPLNALAIITGQAVTTAGTTPNQTVTWTLSAGDRMPYFRVYGKSISEDDDDVHVKLYKCKCTSLEGEQKGEEFVVTKCEGIAIDDGTNGIMDIVHNETAADLPGAS